MNVKTKSIVASVFAAAAIVAAPLSASAHGSYNDSWKRNKRPNIVETAVSINKESGEFSTLIAAASCTNVAERLMNNKRDYTLFAPTDAAFAKLNLNKDNVCSSFDEATLTSILEYHIARGRYTAEEVVSRHKLRMLNGDKAMIDGAMIDGVNIVQTDVKTRNGIIHVIDGVMLP